MLGKSKLENQALIDKFKSEIKLTLDQVNKKAQEAKDEAKESIQKSEHTQEQFKQYIENQKELDKVKDERELERFKGLQGQIDAIPNQIIEQMKNLLRIKDS